MSTKTSDLIVFQIFLSSLFYSMNLSWEQTKKFADRQKEKQTEPQKDRKTKRQREKQTDRSTSQQEGKHIYEQTDRRTSQTTYIKTNREWGKLTKKQADIKHMERQAYKMINNKYEKQTWNNKHKGHS